MSPLAGAEVPESFEEESFEEESFEEDEASESADEDELAVVDTVEPAPLRLSVR